MGCRASPCIGLGAFLLALAGPARADDAVSDEARRHFKAGVALMLDPDGERVEDAYREFREAYALSRSPKILGNIGLCAMKLERDGEAIDAYTTYLREVADIDPAERDQIVRDLQTLTVGVARLSLTVDAPGAQIVDVRVPNRGERITNVYGPVEGGKIELGIRPGHHEITAKAPGYEPSTWELDAHAGGRERHAFTLRKLAPSPAPTPTGARVEATSASSSGATWLPWGVAGTGGAMLAAGAVTGAVALGKLGDLERACPGDVCPASYDLTAERSSVKTLAGVTDVLLVGGGVLVAGGVTWALLARGRGEAAPPGAPAVAAACSPSGCAGHVRVVF